jgi:hypothetical protein
VLVNSVDQLYNGYMKNLFIVFLLFTICKLNAQPPIYDYHLVGKTTATKSVAYAPLSNSISDIVSIGDTIWLGTGKGISLSTDGGNSWTNFYNIPAIGDRSISAIGYYDNVFWAALAYNTELNGTSYQTGGGLVFTTNMGTTWNNIPQPMDEDADSTLTYGINNGVNAPLIRALAVTVPQNNLTFDIGFTPGTIWIASWAGGLRKANINNLIANPDMKWDRVLLPSDDVNSVSPSDTVKFALSVQSGKIIKEGYNNHMGFSIVTTGDNTLYVGTAGEVNKSTDGGKSWTKFSHQNQDYPISGNFVVALGYQESSNTVWGATWRAEDNAEFYGVSSTSDGGETWQTFLTENRVHNFGFGGNAVVAAADEGIFRSEDNGTVWVVPGDIVDSQTGLKLSTTVFYAADSFTGDNTLWLVEYTEGTGNLWTGTWKLHVAAPALTSRSETYAYPNPFSPKMDVLKIKYSTGGVSSSVTIRIFDFAMNYVRTVVQDAERGGTAHVIDNAGQTQSVIDYWDGKDDNGNVVPNGVYFYSVETGSGDPVYGKILVIQ